MQEIRELERNNKSSSTRLDDDLLFLSSSLISCMDIHDTISIDIKGDLNLRNTSWCWRDSCKLELPQQLVVPGHLSLSLVNLQLHLCLAISSCGEHLGLLGGDGRVPVDQLGEDSS